MSIHACSAFIYLNRNGVKNGLNKRLGTKKSNKEVSQLKKSNLEEIFIGPYSVFIKCQFMLELLFY